MLTKKQQQIFDWLNKLQLPVYAEAYKGSVRLLEEKSPGYGTFVSHTGRDIMNFLARTVVGIPSSQVHYKQKIEDLEKKWLDKRHRQEPISQENQGEGYVISQELSVMITNLIEENKEGSRRKQEAAELFFDMFLGSSDKDKDAIRKQWKGLGDFFIGCAHLREDDFSDEVLSKIVDNFKILEEFLYIAAEREYSRIKTLDNILEEANYSRKKPISKKVKKAAKRGAERTLALLESETDRHYFFSRLKNPRWIQPLSERGCFKSPPGIRYLSDDHVQYPIWPELQYLKNVCKDAPEEVIKIVLQLPAIDNPRVYDSILEIALELDSEQSAQLKPKILEYARLEHQILGHEYPKLLAHWTTEDQTEAALVLAKILVQFYPDEKDEDKQVRRRANPNDLTTLLDPQPRFSEWEYNEILRKGVRPMAEKEPYRTAQILLEATATMLRLKYPQDAQNKAAGNDYSMSWCRRVNGPSNKDQVDGPGEDYIDSNERNLVHALTFACEKVYEKAPGSIAALDQALRKKHWYIFKRIRQHLYALHPNEQTEPLIREMILAHKDYDKWGHHFEFQRMIRLACEKLGGDFLTKAERERIFEAILSGPSEPNYRKWMGDRFTEEGFNARKRGFHLAQLTPFTSLLFGQYGDYFEELKAEEEKPITDDSYEPYRSEGAKYGGDRSPKPIEELKKLSDEELLSFLNEWENPHYDADEWWINISFTGLSEAFQSIFKEDILPEEPRLHFWVDNRDRLERPIYVKAMVSTIHKQVESKQFIKLNQWFDFCEWVLSHPDQPKKEGVIRSDESRRHPDWQSARRAVGDFVGMCLTKKVNVPITARNGLASLVDELCTQYDSGLDDEEPGLQNQDDQFEEAYINTRSRALEYLVDFGLWVRRHDGKADVPEIKAILEKRLSSEAKYPLTLPEYAMLGMLYRWIFSLDQKWAIARKSDFFPRNNLRAWREAFGNYLRRHRPYGPIYNELCDNFEFSLEDLDGLKQQLDLEKNSAEDNLGHHFFTYYLWKRYPLKGDESLLQRYYQKTENDRRRWATLFGYIGRGLRNTGKRIDSGFKDRIFAFFEWRLEVGEPLELQKFVNWLEADCLEADCLEAEWRLNAYSRILDLLQEQGVDQWTEQSAHISLYHTIHSMHKMLPINVSGVVECLAKLIDSLPQGGVPYLRTDDAKAILKAGLDHGDEKVRDIARQTQDNLLRRGYLSVKDLEN